MLPEQITPRAKLHDICTITRHINRYLSAVELLGEASDVLDFGCGSGYGTALLANYYTKVTGYDHDSAIIQTARKTYKTEGVTFTDELPSFQYDVVFCMEVFEHVPREDAPALLDQLHCLAETVIISTPIVQQSNPHPDNEWHQYEYDLKEFVSLLADFHITDTLISPTTYHDGRTGQQGLFRLRRRE